MKQQILATVVAHSIAPDGDQIATLELEYPRFIHSELMTHRLFSRNAASSRAIPAKRVRQQVRENPAMPVHWGRNMAGMQAKSKLTGLRLTLAGYLWRKASRVACRLHWAMERIGLHKQLCNRILEPWQLMKVVVTSTEWDNFMHLRIHKDAQPEIYALSLEMKRALEFSEAKELSKGGWHLPYITEEHEGLSLEDKLAVSVSCCAQVSYRRLDDDVEKARAIVKRLRTSDRIHASPFEHQARVMPKVNAPDRNWRSIQGVSHIDRERNIWSGNFKNWVQHRKLIPNEAVSGDDAYSFLHNFG